MTKTEQVLRILDAAVHGMTGRLGEWLYIDAAKAEQRADARKRLDRAMRKGATS